MYEPRTPPSFYPHTRNYPCSYHHNNYTRQQKQPEVSTYNTNYQPKKSFKVKIQSDEDEAKAKINKSQAAHKIYNFIKNQSANKQTRKILNKLHILHRIENELKKIQKTKHLGNLTFDTKENGKQILPISIDNKKFLEYEDKIVKSFDKLDEIQSEGVDIIRDRRKFLVNFAQTLLNELDIEKENQWKTGE
ncbi:18561_t:CDS:2 [Rhizophagus irregularis]|nr:18561_t:CDS:2 [Rhizophagus irregularis]